MKRLIPIVAFVILTTAISLSAQDRRRGYDPAQRLKALDSNGDGKLEKEEIPERFRSFMVKRFEEAGLDPAKPVDIEEYLKASRDRRSGDSGRDRDRSNDDKKRNGSETERAVPGFGETVELAAVPGFGESATDGDGKVRASGVPLEDIYDERIVRYVESIMRRYDRNGDKTIDSGEWRRGRWRDPGPEESDSNGDGSLSRRELCERVSNYDDFKGLRKSTRDSGSSSSGSSDDRSKYATYAKSLLTRYDENKNGVLEADEWGKMSKYHHEADANGDKVITADELADRLASYGKKSSGRSGGSGSYSSDDSSPAAPGESYRVTGESRFVRVTPNVERLPKGLPDWFTRNDANADGQIAMGEFAVSWSDEKIAEFKQLDANADGIITPAECLAGQTESKSSSGYSRSRRR